MRSLVRAFLFDMDGTIVDSLADIGGSMNHVLESYALPTHPIDAYKALVGEGAASLIARALPSSRADLREDALRRYKERYRAQLVAESRPYAGIVDMLRALAARGDRLAVVTNKPQAAADEIAKHLFEPGLFGVVIGDVDGRPRKPSAAPALAAAEALGMSPTSCVFVGDTAIDIETSHAAGMTSVGVLWGFRDRAELEGARAHHIVAQPSEILAL
jgi:phosphoglycolate phosphatase